MWELVEMAKIINTLIGMIIIPVCEFELISEIEGKENRNEIEHDLKQRGFEYVENIGFIRMLNS